MENKWAKLSSLSGETDEEFIAWRNKFRKRMEELNLEPGTPESGYLYENQAVEHCSKPGTKAHRIISPYRDRTDEKVNLLEVLNNALCGRQIPPPQIKVTSTAFPQRPKTSESPKKSLTPESRTKSVSDTPKRAQHVEKGFEIFCEVCGGENLSQHPYVVIKCGGARAKTKVIKHNTQPHVNWCILTRESFVFSRKKTGRISEIKFVCRTWEKARDAKLGTATVSFNELIDGSLKEYWLDLKSGTKKVAGKIHIRIHLRKVPTKDKHLSKLWKAVKTLDLPLIKAQIEKNNNDHDWDERGHGSISILHLAIEICAQNRTPVAEEMLATLLTARSNKTLVDEEGDSPLHYFCRKITFPNCQTLFSQLVGGGADVNAKNFSGQTPLHHAILNPSIMPLMVQLLLEHGAISSLTDNKGNAFFHYAINELGNIESIIKICILFDVDFSLVGEEGIPAIDLARSEAIYFCLRNYIEITSWLKQHGFQEWLPQFLDHEIFLFFLPGMDEKTLKRAVPNDDAVKKILAAAQVMTPEQSSDSLTRRVAHVDKQRAEKQKEEILRESLVNIFQKTQPGTVSRKQTWELEVENIEFIKHIGSGQFGDVYQGSYCSKVVAIKKLKPCEGSQRDFIDEFAIMITIRSPYLVELYGATLVPEMLIMEFCANGSLYNTLRSRQVVLSWNVVLGMIRDMMGGLIALHTNEHAVFHRDLKSLNVLVTEDFKAKIGDFGLSRFQTATATLKQRRGTYAYMAPESLNTDTVFTAKADIYALSIIMWEMVTRLLLGTYEAPFKEYSHINANHIQVVYQAKVKNLRPTIRKNTPPCISTIITASWNSDPNHRPEIVKLNEALKLVMEEYAGNVELWDSFVVVIPPAQSSESSDF